MSARHSYLSTAELARLNHACLPVAEAFPMSVYLVGSATERPDFRDVDVRVILQDEEWDELFAGKPFVWSLFCLGVNEYLSRVTGMPIDFQVQRMTEANEKHPSAGSRIPLGKRHRPFAGGGDATPYTPADIVAAAER